MRATYVAAAMLAACATSAKAETVVRMTAEIEYAIRNRLADRDGAWFATYEITGTLNANQPGAPLDQAGIVCIGAARGMGREIAADEGFCRLGEPGRSVLFGRIRSVSGEDQGAVLDLDLFGGGGTLGGLAGEAMVLRSFDLTGERPTGRGRLSLRLRLTEVGNGAE